MAKFTYKITDIEALAAAYPQAVEVIKSPIRQEIGKLWRAAQVLGHTIPGVEAVEISESAQAALSDIPAHMAGKAE